MNESNQCCQAAETNTALCESQANETSYADPQWTAERHENGVDLDVTLPGVSRDDLKLEVEGRQLRLEATRKPSDRGRLIRGSAAPEAYRLRLRLGESLDGSKLTAKLADGVLRLHLPLIESAQARKIEVN